MSNQKFTEGQKVAWVSQSQGSFTHKTGVVHLVIAAGESPSRVLFPSLYTGAGPGSARDHESYIILVTKAGAKPRVYWPRASKLEAAQ